MLLVSSDACRRSPIAAKLSKNIASGVAQGDNLKLAEPRYQEVQRALIARGVAAAAIARSSLPDAGVNTGPTADTRVEIILSR